MADYCNLRKGASGNTAASMGTFRTGQPTSLGYHHNTLTRTTKIGISALGAAGAGGGSGSIGGLTMAEVKERMATIDGSGQQRVRMVRLTRPQGYSHGHFNGGGNFGFSIRGGLEYGTGFFVSDVQKDSEADRQGLRVGDQIIRVNGYQVDDAVHRELAHFVSCQERLVLKVRSVGILPVKERSADPLTWHVVSISTGSGPPSHNGHPANGSTKKHHQHRSELERTSCSSSNSSTGSSGTLEEIPGGRDIKVVLSVAPRTKLGCGICKGPDWKPGIFVQFTKEGGVARESGLRPGDQIMSCNGREFADITFAEAVSIMKASQVLELVVRPGAGIDMFPGESSGYNSSASSVNGDQSPCWGDSTAKRLSIVREESISKDRQRNGQRAEKVQGPKMAGGHRRNNTTIIEFSENGTVVNSTLISQDGAGGKKEMETKEGSKKLADICFVSKQSETKTVIVEVHRSASTNSIATGSPTSSSGVSTVSSGSTSHIPPPPPLFADKIPPPPPPSSGLSSGYSTTNSAKSGLGGQHQQRSPSSVSLADSSASSGIDCGSSNNGGIGGLGSAISEELKRRAQKKGSLLSTAQEPAAALTELENRLKEKRFRPPVNSGSDAARHTALMDEFRAVHKRMFKNGFDHAELKKAPSKDKLPIEVRPPGTANASTSNGTSPPSGKGTMGRVAASELAKANGDIAELESIESFQLTSPTPTLVRPPSYYFCPQNTGPPTMKKSQKPIAVTISEYIGVGTAEPPKKPSIGLGNLKYELEKTLSLSNLRQRSESREDLVERIQIGCGQQQDQGAKLSRSSSAVTTVSNGNRITIAISNGAEKK
ncbi:uncharacterized protein LOC5566765 [Aedes aegypti]|uniref:PDZ domain-containing protein n=1 Tax=Aedes aegypti TaxID=7159 RepID=A0A6I8TBP8_AEDAE|nr:uncharacterized protein LOC5566765 [Aedes aegypti]XP_021701530.1 uncharacterized protein LOC5566765 [Aedes aegypti]XP_021701595.1 uncharacterized protein LOC5566765 [Aedes aegypti]XP_021701634.1 uncharacterized protein LOC5566765 [Aedes aegypti]XP_021701690.1 uncharacterized protein LOC5566765 [Aedes aegypti]XP_021701743.1 uncharacterized protein LOC5566765 [Aedes aegypti]XP_021701798.1 uncharacterized protein LOC5566765 [Aedes aegypti]